MALATSPVLSELQVRLGYAFRQSGLLQQAVTHRSFSADHNERLEFLGDSVLNLSVAHLLYTQLASLPEGDLSRVRANLVKQETLHQLAKTLDLPAVMRLGEGEMRSGGQSRPSILADALEAIIGAVYLDGGYKDAQALVERLFAQVDIKPDMQAAGKDPKTELQEWLQGRKLALPKYTVVGTSGAAQYVFVDTPGFQTIHGTALNKSLNKTVVGAVSDVDLVLFVVEAGSFTTADAKVLALLKPGIPVLLVANKLDNVHRRGDIAPWLQSMQERHAFNEFVPMSAKQSKDIVRLLDICEKYLPEQPWWHAEDELTDRSEKFLASEMVREKLFRLTGDELPYTSTVVIDKFEEEAGRTAKRMLRIAATIVVEREGHKAMVIGDKGEKLKRIGTETRVELEKLLDAKVFIELWVKVRSGWADDEARVRSFGYE